MTKKEETLTKKDWDIILECLEFGIRQGGSQTAIQILPIMEKINSSNNKLPLKP